jgi:hypothetical protein
MATWNMAHLRYLKSLMEKMLLFHIVALGKDKDSKSMS